jgi:hypothetical protein
MKAGLTRIIDNGHGARIRGDDRWNLSSSPPLFRDVRCSIEIGKEIRAVEICGGDPRVLVIIITFPMDQILGLAAMEAETNDVVHLIFGMAVGKLYGRETHWSTLELCIRMVGAEKFCMKGIVDTAS